MIEKFKHPFLNIENVKQRLLDDFKKHGSIIVAFDFDNTIYDYKQKGDDYSEVIDLLKNCSSLGKELFTMVLFTAEEDSEKLEWKKQYCKEHGIRVDYVNESPIMQGSGKPYYNILLDDRAGLLESFLVLSYIYEYVTNN